MALLRGLGSWIGGFFVDAESKCRSCGRVIEAARRAQNAAYCAICFQAANARWEWQYDLMEGAQAEIPHRIREMCDAGCEPSSIRYDPSSREGEAVFREWRPADHAIGVTCQVRTQEKLKEPPPGIGRNFKINMSCKISFKRAEGADSHGVNVRVTGCSVNNLIKQAGMTEMLVHYLLLLISGGSRVERERFVSEGRTDELLIGVVACPLEFREEYEQRGFEVVREESALSSAFHALKERKGE